MTFTFWVHSDIESIEDLGNQNEIPYGTVKDSAVWDYFKNHQDDLYHTMYKYMMEKDTTVTTTKQGLDKVNEGYGKSKGTKIIFPVNPISALTPYHN